MANIVNFEIGAMATIGPAYTVVGWLTNEFEGEQFGLNLPPPEVERDWHTMVYEKSKPKDPLPFKIWVRDCCNWPAGNEGAVAREKWEHKKQLMKAACRGFCAGNQF